MSKLLDVALPITFYIGMFLLIILNDTRDGAMFLWGSLITIISIFILYKEG